MSDLFLEITAIATLHRGWAKVQRNGGGPGGDGMTLASFANGLERRLSLLRAALVSGEYWPGPLRVVEIPKRHGGARVLRIPTIADRVAQSAAALVLTPLLDAEFEEASFGYRPGRSVQQAVARVAALRNQGYVWTVDGDIEAYFDNIPHRKLLDRLARSVDCERTCDLVSRWLEAYSDSERGVPQGGPISPLLANLYLDDIDEALDGKGLRLVRFADDFLILCKSELAAEKAHGRVADLLRAAGLRLNPDKTRITRFEDATRFLGHLFVRGLMMPQAYEEEIARASQETPAEPAPPPDDGDDLAPRLRWLYLHTPGRVLNMRNMSLTVEDEEGAELAALPPGWASGIELGAAARATDAGLRLAMAHGVSVHYLDGDGSVLGRLEPKPDERAALQLEQARHVLDPALRIDVARRIVAGRLGNQRAQLYRLNRSRHDDAVKDAARRIGRLAKLALIQTEIEALMGVEGRAGALYWPAFGRCLRHVRFDARRRRPPPDPVNMVLSVLSGRLSRDVDALICKRGLHPGFAFLHASQDARPNLALDLMEPFRAPLVEGVTAALFNRRALSEAMFVRTDEGVRATPEAWRHIIGAYESAAARVLKDPRSGRRHALRGLIEEEVLALMRHIRGDEPYRAFVMDY